MRYEKPCLTTGEQADLLLARGMRADRDALAARLDEVGYYRLSGYWHIFKRSGSEEFCEGATLDRVWRLYAFDRQFRLVVLDAVERVEVYMRSQLARLLASEGGPFGFEEAGSLPRMSASGHERFMGRCRDAYARSREPFALHFRRAYGDEHELPPYWMLVNLMDFGMIVSLYKGAPVSVRRAIADGLGVSARVLDSWLVTTNTVRNICAHHGRLWNRVIGTPPMIPRASEWHEPFEVEGRRIFGTLTVLSYLLARVAPGTSWRARLLALVGGLPRGDRGRMGFSEGWEGCPMWGPWAADGRGAAVSR